MIASRTDLWDAVDALVDRARDLDGLRAHNLQLVAARRWRALARPVPPELVEEERHAAIVSVTVPLLLGRVRAACEGPIVVFKGPEIGARYPNPAARSYRDVDLLVSDALRVQRELLAAGFVETGEEELYRDIHHLRPLMWPGLPLLLEVHERPKWLDWASAPPTEELIAAAVPSRLGVEGVLALAPAHHTLVLAAHSWSHEPLRRLRDLVDIAAAAREADRAELAATARAWGMAELWRTTAAVVDAALFGGRPPFGPSIWARNVRIVRERNVLERHLERWLSPFSALPSRPALTVAADALAADLSPAGDEPWSAKLARTRRAIRGAFVPQSEHRRGLAAASGEKERL